MYSRLVEYLSLHDIHLLISVLECLYSLTSLGEVPCTHLVRTHSAVELLVSLVTVEAQSYGPKACILMRVVDTVPGNTAAVQPPAAAGVQQPPCAPVTSAPLQAPSQTSVAGTAANSLMKTPLLPTAP